MLSLKAELLNAQSLLKVENQKVKDAESLKTFHEQQIQDLQTKLQHVSKQHAQVQHELIEEGKAKFNSQMQFSETIRQNKQVSDQLNNQIFELSTQNQYKDMELTKSKIEVSNLSAIKQQLQ